MCYPISVNKMRKAMETLEQMGYSDYDLRFTDDDGRLLSICTPILDADITKGIVVDEVDQSVYFCKESAYCSNIGKILECPEENWVGNTIKEDK